MGGGLRLLGLGRVGRDGQPGVIVGVPILLYHHSMVFELFLSHLQRKFTHILLAFVCLLLASDRIQFHVTQRFREADVQSVHELVNLDLVFSRNSSKGFGSSMYALDHSQPHRHDGHDNHQPADSEAGTEQSHWHGSLLEPISITGRSASDNSGPQGRPSRLAKVQASPDPQGKDRPDVTRPRPAGAPAASDAPKPPPLVPSIPRGVRLPDRSAPRPHNSKSSLATPAKQIAKVPFVPDPSHDVESARQPNPLPHDPTIIPLADRNVRIPAPRPGSTS